VTVERDPEIQAVIDKLAIQEVYARYMRGADRADRELLQSCFHPGAVESHSGIHDGSGESFVDLAIGLLQKLGRCAHYFMFPMVELHGDTALSECYAIAFHRVERDGDQEAYDSVFGARVLDKFERRNGEWKIASRRVIYDWQRDMPVMETWGRGFFGPVYSDAGKGNADPSFGFFGKRSVYDPPR